MENNEYDVVVVGSGIGGVSAAALLAHEGYKTLVVEKLPEIGGRYSTTEEQGFKLTTGATVVEMGGVLQETFEQVGAEFNVQPITEIRYRIEGKDYKLPKGALRTLVRIASDNDKDCDRVLNAFRNGLDWMSPVGSISFYDWLIPYAPKEKVLKLFNTMIIMNHGIKIWEIPAGEYFQFFKVMGGFNRIGFAANGFLTLMQSLANGIRGKGSQILTRCTAKKILVSDRMAKGVQVEKEGRTIEIGARAVISDAGPQKTVEMAGWENFDKWYLQALTQKLKPVPLFTIHVISDRPLVEYPALVVTDARRIFDIMCPTLICPDLAPPGMHLIDCSGPSESSLNVWNIRSDIEMAIQDLRDNIPNFDKYGKILSVHTFHDEWPLYRSWPGLDLPQKTPIKYLYNVGDGVKPPGLVGGPACVQSARIVVEDIKRRFRPRGNNSPMP